MTCFNIFCLVLWVRFSHIFPVHGSPEGLECNWRNLFSGICNMLSNWSRERNWELGLQWIQGNRFQYWNRWDLQRIFPRIPLCQNILLELKMSKQNVLTLPNLDSSPWKGISFQEEIKLPGVSYGSSSSFFSSPIITPPLNILVNSWCFRWENFLGYFWKGKHSPRGRILF